MAFRDVRARRASRRRARASVALLVALLGPVTAGRAATYYVDDDAAAGGDGSEGAPFQTIQAAAAVMTAGDTCRIRAGTYRECVTPANSGTAMAPLTFEAYPGESVTVSGCDAVGGWTQHDGQIYKATVTLALPYDRRQVFADNHMMLAARWPNAGAETPSALLSFLTETMQAGTTPEKIVCSGLPWGDWTNAHVWVASGQEWYCWTGQITNAEPETLYIENTSDAAGKHECEPGGNFYAFGSYAALDAENEWHYDEAATTLYVYVAGGGDPGARVEVRQRTDAFDLSARDYVRIRNLGIHAASIVTDADSSGMELDGLTIRYVYHSALAEENYASQRTDSGLHLRGSGHTLRNSEIAYSSGNGVLFGADADHCQVINCYIHLCDYIGSYATAVEFAENTRSHVLSHCTLYDAGRSLIGTTGFYDCLAQYNDVGYAGYLTRDLGLTYGNGVEGGNSEIRYNWFHDVLTDFGTGVYFDHGCRNVLMHHNVVWNTALGCMGGNLYANFMLYYNNTLIGESSSTGSFGHGPWANAQQPEAYGCRGVNNLCNNQAGNYESEFVLGTNIFLSGDIGTGNWLPAAGTAPVNSGFFIEGITTNAVGGAPDLGAYEVGAASWTAGHDFASPPSLVDTNRSLPRHRNLLVNPAHHRGTWTGWTHSGDAVAIVYENNNQAVDNGKTVMRLRSVEMGTGVNRIEQTVQGLSPDTTYELMGMFRVPVAEAARLGAQDFGGAETNVAAPEVSPYWGRATLTFRTGAASTSATIYAEKTSAGGGLVYVDNMGLRCAQEFWTNALANAGVDQTVTNLLAVNLDGSRSYDPPGGAALGYAWTQVDNGAPSQTLTGADTATPSFTPTAAATYTFELAVEDAGYASAHTDTVDVVVVADETAPVLESASAIVHTQVRAVFSEALDPASAQTASNYSLNKGATVTAAVLESGGGLTVRLAVSGMFAGTTYTLTVQDVTDTALPTGNAVAPGSTAVFTVPGGVWSLPITFSGYDGTTPLTNFPALIRLGPHVDALDYTTFLHPANGHDLRFRDAYLSEVLDYEIDTWRDDDDVSFVWVRVPALTNGTTIYATWGNTAETNRYASNTNGATWDATFRAVWHLSEAAGAAQNVESTANARHALPVNTPTLGVTGKVGRAVEFESDNAEYLSIGTSTAYENDTAGTVSLWFRPSSLLTANGVRRLLAYGDNTDETRSYIGFEMKRNSAVDNNNHFALQWNRGAVGSLMGTLNLVVGQWYHAAWRADGTTNTLYVNGVPDTLRLLWNAPASPVWFNATPSDPQHTLASSYVQGAYGNYADGALDDVRVASAARSADWLRAEWMTVADADFSVFGTAERGPDPPPSAHGAGTSIRVY